MGGGDAGSAWYLAQVRPNQFQIAEANLARQHFRVFAPTQEVTRRRGARFVTQRQALFPGYLFVAFSPHSNAWRTVASTYGISRIVSFGGVPKPVPEALVSGLMARCCAEGSLVPSQLFKRGDEVNVLNGPLAGFIARVEYLTPAHRVWVLLDILGSQTRVSLALSQVLAMGG